METCHVIITGQNLPIFMAMILENNVVLVYFSQTAHFLCYTLYFINYNISRIRLYLICFYFKF